MPRWLQIALCLVLFAAAMQLVRLALHVTVPGIVEAAGDRFGERTVLAVTLAFIASLAALAVWLHRREALSR